MEQNTTCNHFDLVIFRGFPFVSLLGDHHREGALSDEEKNKGRGQKTLHGAATTVAGDEGTRKDEQTYLPACGRIFKQISNESWNKTT